MKKVVLLGGGTGLSNLIEALKYNNLDLSVGVAVSDNGGSTGKIRKYYDIPAPGDLRKVINSFIEDDKVSRLFEYRFDEQLETHTVGNLLLAALVDIEGNMSDAVKTYCEIFNIKNDIYPISNASVQLSAVMDDKNIIDGEEQITKNKRLINEVFYKDNIRAEQGIIKKIKEADFIIFSAGSLYTSLLPNLIIKEVQEEIKKNKCLKIYISNIMTQKGETENYTVSDHIKSIENHTYEGIIDIIIANNFYDISKGIKDKYAKEGSKLVQLDKMNLKNSTLYEEKLIKENDYIRHDVNKVSRLLVQIMERNIDG